MSLNFTDDQPTLVQVMAWCCQATSHYLSQFWPRSLSPYGVTRPQWVNQKSTMVQVMAWCHPATSHYLSQCWPWSMLPYGATRHQWVELLKLIWISGYHISNISWWNLHKWNRYQWVPYLWMSCSDLTRMGGYQDCRIFFFCRFYLPAPDLQTICRDLITWQGTRIVVPAMATRWYALLIDEIKTESRKLRYWLLCWAWTYFFIAGSGLSS